MKLKESEARIQSKFFIWLWNKYPKTRYLCYHISNGGLRSIAEAVSFKAQGVVAGMPDIHIAIAARGYNSMYIEFKAPGWNPNTDHHRNQLKAIECLKAAGNHVIICESTEHAKSAVIEYLANTEYIT